MKKLIDKWKQLGKGTKVRTVLMIVAYINQMVALAGQTTFASSAAYQWASFGVTILISVVGYWYNNDWTEFSMLCSDVFDMLKDGKITVDELQKFIKKHEKKKAATIEQIEKLPKNTKEEEHETK